MIEALAPRKYINLVSQLSKFRIPFVLFSPITTIKIIYQLNFQSLDNTTVSVPYPQFHMCMHPKDFRSFCMLHILDFVY